MHVLRNTLPVFKHIACHNLFSFENIVLRSLLVFVRVKNAMAAVFRFGAAVFCNGSAVDLGAADQHQMLGMRFFSAGSARAGESSGRS
ncbi:MAG: hypothetical protein ROZ09_01760 [Thiobacillus sp.]|uniref:hypothetical protein n=1 Tax=Thiobacillus sp. TaxID=924 RepID=UPI002893E6C5|nr:hypothetical protein [Thiobacillus sp.]MDT3705521.1 hypothetical protein [Thiobacillus sp.]